MAGLERTSERERYSGGWLLERKGNREKTEEVVILLSGWRDGLRKEKEREVSLRGPFSGYRGKEESKTPERR